MRVMAIYLLIVVLAESVAVLIGLELDTNLSSFSVPVALLLFGSALTGGWYLAVYITERWFPDPVIVAISPASVKAE
jgi:hypothetical protein